MEVGSLWRGPDPPVLASASQTRRALLEAAGLPCESQPAAIDERALESELAGAAPEQLAAALAAAKALAVSKTRPGRIVVGADQVLDLGGLTLHKAKSRGEALEQLLMLSGYSHRLISAFAIAEDGRVLATGSGEAELTMRALDRSAASLYLDLAGETATASVGCYALEGLGIHLFERVEGEHTAIMGLPMLPLLAALRRLGRLLL